MKYRLSMIISALAVLVPLGLSAQTSSDPEGYVTYSLPSTTITLDVEAVQEKFFAGPYAAYAEKYLGIKARQKDETTCQLTQITMTPYIEADQSRRYSFNVAKGNVASSFLKLTSSGLVSFSDSGFGNETVWRFPIKVDGDFSDKGVSSNLISESATLYRSDRKDAVYNKVSVQQNVVVEKSLEKKAAETAEMILNIRKQRLQIVTGDTDATYSGEAMGAAVAELTRLEDEYMTLFVGYTLSQTQRMRFDVVPDAGRTNQMYVAFRLSDTAGLLPADNISGRPVVMDITVQEFAPVEMPAVADPKEKRPVMVYCRIPAACTVKLLNGTELLLQSRIPVYQLGQESSFPVNVILK